MQVFLRKLLGKEEPRRRRDWVLPPAPELLDHDEAQGVPVDRRELQARLHEFGVISEVIEINTGPVVTTYDIALLEGTRGRLLDRNLPDVARTLGVASIRNAGPRRGSPAISLEIPNEAPQPVYLNTGRINPRAFDIPVPLGVDTRGIFEVVDLTKAPHLLIAGATGTGKSTFLHAMITSILATKTPDEVSFMFIDPKRVELAQYDGIPHLAEKTAFDMWNAADMVRTIVRMMDERFRRIRNAGVRDIENYNALCPDSPMPRIVLLIEEFASLITQLPNIDTTIARIAAEGRAAGIHAVLATQNPIVKYVTSSIKANFTTRICFKVPTGVNSRVVLDQNGAEDLLGYGDMLVMSPYFPGQLRRFHGAMADHEQVVNHWRLQA